MPDWQVPDNIMMLERNSTYVIDAVATEVTQWLWGIALDRTDYHPCDGPKEHNTSQAEEYVPILPDRRDIPEQEDY